MTETSQHLVPVRSNAIAAFVAEARLAAQLNFRDLPPQLAEPLLDVLVGFPAGAQVAQSDRNRFLRLMCEAMADHTQFVAEAALKYLKFNNPRNPFPPTPQDLSELCEKVRTELRHAVSGFYFTGRHWIRDHKYVSLGGQPGQVDCAISRELIVDLLRAEFHAHEDYSRNRITELSDEAFLRLPRELFTDEGHAWLVAEQRRHSALRQEYEDRNAEYVRRRPFFTEPNIPTLVTTT